MTATRSSLALAVSFLLVVGATFAVPVEAAETISYEDAEPFFSTMTEAVESADDRSLNVIEHDDSLDGFEPGEMSSLMEYANERAEEAEDSETTRIVDRKFQVVGERLSVCLGTERDDGSTIARTTFCQDLENNLLNRVVLEDAEGNVLGRYELN